MVKTLTEPVKSEFSMKQSGLTSSAYTPTATLACPSTQWIRCERQITAANLSGTSKKDIGFLVVSSLYEVLSRLQSPKALALSIGQECFGWDGPPDGLSELTQAQANSLLSAAVGAVDRDAIVVSSGQANPAIETLTITYRIETDTLHVECSAPKSWGRTISPGAELDAIAEMLSSIMMETANNPDMRMGDAKGLTDAARTDVLGTLAGTRQDYGPFKPLQKMLHDSAEIWSDRIAYRFQDRALTYSEFEALANGLAAELKAEGLRKGQIIPVMFANGLEMPITYYATMKCGAALVAVDFEWPEDRLDKTLGQLPDVPILTSEGVALPKPFDARQKIIRVSDIVPESEELYVPVDPCDVIYGFFTSGTTGVPKCALNNHGAICNRFYAMNDFMGDIGGAVLQNTRYMYDSSIGHMFLALTQGHTVVLPEDGRVLDLHYTIDIIDRFNVAMTDFVPSVLNQLIALVEKDSVYQAKLMSLRELIVGGEQITPKMIQKLRALLSDDLRINNCYGITETAIGLTYHTVTDDDGIHIPLGRPLNNCFVVIADDQLRPLPKGGIGQIMVGGVCVGNGYMSNPQKTAEVFLPNPFPEIPGDVLYASGDNGYFSAAGELEFIGRRDFITKVGGALVEPAEIEQAASSCGEVHQCKAFEYKEFETTAMALIASGSAKLTEELLVSHLKSKLPKSSVPRHVVVLDEMPLADSGKLDQKRLQTVVEDHLDQKRREAEPATAIFTSDETTQNICSIFEASLRGAAIEPDTDFFDAGGDSLLAVHVALQVEEECRVAFAVSELINNPTPRQISARINELIDAGPGHLPVTEKVAADIDELSSKWPVRFNRADGADPQTVLLTGATGFVGGHLAAHLLEHSDAKVIALCRGGQDRLRNVLASRNLLSDAFHKRLEVLSGDLAQPKLGLDTAGYMALADQCDAILHCGALVNFAYDYDAHRGANVLGTNALIELAGQGRAKAFHHISTMGVLGEEHAPDLNDHNLRRPSLTALPAEGYSQSKLAAERLIEAAVQRGLAASIYRLGEIMPHSMGGAPNEMALTHMLLKACGVVKAVPDVVVSTDWTPVDVTCERILRNLSRRISGLKITHEFYPHSQDLFGIFDGSGLALERVPAEAWLARIDASLASDPCRHLLALRNMFPADTSPGRLDAFFNGLFMDAPGKFPMLSSMKPAKDAAVERSDESIRHYAQDLVAKSEWSHRGT